MDYQVLVKVWKELFSSLIELKDTKFVSYLSFNLNMKDFEYIQVLAFAL